MYSIVFPNGTWTATTWISWSHKQHFVTPFKGQQCLLNSAVLCLQISHKLIDIAHRYLRARSLHTWVIVYPSLRSQVGENTTRHQCKGLACNRFDIHGNSRMFSNDKACQRTWQKEESGKAHRALVPYRQCPPLLHQGASQSQVKPPRATPPATCPLHTQTTARRQRQCMRSKPAKISLITIATTCSISKWAVFQPTET